MFDTIRKAFAISKAIKQLKEQSTRIQDSETWKLTLESVNKIIEGFKGLQLALPQLRDLIAPVIKIFEDLI